MASQEWQTALRVCCSFIVFQHYGHKAKIKRHTWYTAETTTLVYDAELLRSLICEDRPVHKIWTILSTGDIQNKRETLTGLVHTGLLSRRNRAFLFLWVEAISYRSSWRMVGELWPPSLLQGRECTATICSKHSGWVKHGTLNCCVDSYQINV